jgi:hypothetical protein
VRLQDLRDVIDKYFEIIEWKVSVEGLDRLTPEIRHKWRKYTLDELLGQNIYITGRRRDVPLGNDIARRPFHHPPEAYLADKDYSAEPIEPYGFANSVYFAGPNELCSHSDNNTAGARVFERLRPGDRITLAKFTGKFPVTVAEVVQPAGVAARIKIRETINDNQLKLNYDQWTIADYGPGAAVPGEHATPPAAHRQEDPDRPARPTQNPVQLFPVVEPPPLPAAKTSSAPIPAAISGPQPGAPLANAILAAIDKYGSDIPSVRFISSLATAPGEAAYTALQDRNRGTLERAARPDGDHKYLDIPFWVGHKLTLARKLRLDSSKPLNILDLGTGAGHFLFVARSMGHHVIGIDGANTLHADVASVLGVDRRTQAVVRGQPLPDFSRKFDLVTSIWINYDQTTLDGQQVYWTPAEWAGLLNDIVERQLAVPGRIYLELNQQRGRDGVYAHNQDLLSWFERQGAAVDKAHGIVDIQLSQPKRFTA